MLQVADILLYIFLGILIGFVLGSRTAALSKPKPINPPSLEANEECKMVLIVRTELKMDKGKVAAQCSHATLVAYQRALGYAPEYLKRWEDYGTAKITLKINTEKEMLDLQKKARKAGLVAVSILDAGKTQIAAGSRTVLAIGPGPLKLIDTITGDLKLY